MASLVAIIFITITYALFAGKELAARKRILEGPPTVFVYSPQDGDTYESGTILTASAVASGANPISRVELWLDGEQLGTQIGESIKQVGAPSMHARFNVQIDKGPHMLSWRAIDNTGLVGQSPPITIFGSHSAADAGVQIDKVVGDGVNIADVAAEHNVEPNEIRKLNPGLGEGPIPNGAKVNVPDPNNPGGGGTAPDLPEPNPLPDVPPDTPMLEVVATTIAFPIDFRLFMGVLPSAPKLVKAGFEDCRVRLWWADYADNESYFNVWMQAIGGPPMVIAKLEGSPATGPAWYEFDSPSFGVYYFWVEAVNGAGVQPSEVKLVVVNDDDCGPGIANELRIEAVTMDIYGGSWEKVYCYLSLEGAPEKRIPYNDDEFLAFNGGDSWNISEWMGGNNRILIPIPADEELTLEGECFGWIGNDGPHSLGTFHERIPKSQWDGRNLQIDANQFYVVYRVNYHGPIEASGGFIYHDPNLEVPYGLRITRETSTNRYEDADLSRYPTLHWKWDGSSDELTGFTIRVNGNFFATTPPDVRESTMMMPSTCGGTYLFQVAANSDAARSIFSETSPFYQLPCPVMVEVKFLTAYSEYTDDGHGGECDDLAIYYNLWVIGGELKEHNYWNSNNPFSPYKCKTVYTFKPQLGATEDTMVVPIDPVNPRLIIGTDFWEEDDFGDDIFGETSTLMEREYTEWLNVDKDVIMQAPLFRDTATMEIRVHVRGLEYPGH